MSISLLISGNDITESDWEGFPIATESAFQEVWLPLSSELNLQYIPLFQVGLNIDTNTLDDVLDELEQMRYKLVEKLSNDKYKKIIERIDYMINNLPNFIEKYKTVFIG